MIYKKILVPLSGTESAEKSIPYVKNIAKLTRSGVILFSVSLKVFVERRDRLFTSYLESTAKEFKNEGIKVTTASSYGNVAKEIIEYATNNHIDLIVMSTHSYTGAKKWMFGSITQKVLYGTMIPVLLVKSKGQDVSTEFNNILVATDGSPFSEATFPHVVALAKNTHRKVLILHICEPPIVPSYGSRPINAKWMRYRDDMWSEMEKQATNYLKKIMAVMKKQGVNVKGKVIKAQTKDVTKTIRQISKEENIDLKIIATKGRTGLDGLIYGRVANKIVEESAKPVLLIFPKEQTPTSSPSNILDDIWHGFTSSKV